MGLCSAFTSRPGGRLDRCENPSEFGDRCRFHYLGIERYRQALGICSFLAFGKGALELMTLALELGQLSVERKNPEMRKTADEAWNAAKKGDVDKARAALERGRQQRERSTSGL